MGRRRGRCSPATSLKACATVVPTSTGTATSRSTSCTPTSTTGSWPRCRSSGRRNRTPSRGGSSSRGTSTGRCRPTCGMGWTVPSPRTVSPRSTAWTICTRSGTSWCVGRSAPSLYVSPPTTAKRCRPRRPRGCAPSPPTPASRGRRRPLHLSRRRPDYRHATLPALQRRRRRSPPGHPRRQPSPHRGWRRRRQPSPRPPARAAATLPSPSAPRLVAASSAGRGAAYSPPSSCSLPSPASSSPSWGGRIRADPVPTPRRRPPPLRRRRLPTAPCRASRRPPTPAPRRRLLLHRPPPPGSRRLPPPACWASR